MNFTNPGKEVIRAIEQIARFLIISIHDGFCESSMELYMNMKQLTGLLDDLRHLYQRVTRQFDDGQIDKATKDKLLKY